MEPTTPPSVDWLASNLDTLGGEIWRALEQCTSDVTHPFRAGVFGTRSSNEHALRVMVLRQANRAERALICYSDMRAAKVRHIQLHWHVQWLFFDPRENVQIRCRGCARIHHRDDVARDAWQNVPPANRVNYCSVEPPGTEVPRPDPGWPQEWKERSPGAAELEAGFNHFAVIVTEVESIDWLRVHPSGNRRAGFYWDGAQFSGVWLIP